MAEKPANSEKPAAAPALIYRGPGCVPNVAPRDLLPADLAARPDIDWPGVLATGEYRAGPAWPPPPAADSTPGAQAPVDKEAP